MQFTDWCVFFSSRLAQCACCAAIKVIPSRMDQKYRARINRVLEYIEERLPERLSLAEVAAVSHFSEYHFHRIFSAALGETVNDYIARRRLERAVNKLIFQPDISVTQIALEGGFSSSANFSKAVSLYFGFSPSEIRDPARIKNSKIGKLQSKYGKAFNPSYLYPDFITSTAVNTKNEKDLIMNVEIKELACMPVCTLASDGGYSPEAIYETWDRLIRWAENNGVGAAEQSRFALAFDNPAITPVNKCRYTAAIVIPESLQVPEPFSSAEIPAGKYAVLYFKGTPEETLAAQLGLYSEWFPDSGFEPDNFPMMEHYLNDARVDGYVEMELMVKLKQL